MSATEVRSVKGQCEKGKSRSGAGFEVNPQNINRDGGPDADATYAYLIKVAGETQSKKDTTKTRKMVAIEAQWDKAEDGDARSLELLMEREEGKAMQSIDHTSNGETVSGFLIELIHAKESTDTGEA